MNGKGDRNRSISKNYSTNYDLINWENNVSFCKGENCPISNDCVHFYSKNYSDEIISPFNLIEGTCSEFVSKKCVEEFNNLENFKIDCLKN